MSNKRKWLRAIFLVMLCSFGALNPKNIENTLYVMNQTKVEFSLRDEGDSGGGGPDGYWSLEAIS